MARTVSVNLVANIGQYVGGMNTAAAATMRLGETATTSSKQAQSGFDLAGKSSLIMGAVVVGGLGMAISKSLDFEKSMSAVGAATQATGATLLDLRAAAMKAGADTAFSATEAADAITEMGKAGVSAKDIMGGGLTGALSLAAAGQIDVAEAAGIASTAMTQFSLSGKDLPHVADLLAAGAGKAMGSVDDLGMALNQAGLIAASSGLSIEETTGTLAAFASAGLLGSDAGTSMKTMLQKLQAPSKEAAGVMSELGINMYDASGNMLSMSGMAGQLKDHMAGLTQEQRNNALATIFGSDAVRAANVLYAQGSQGIADWTTKVSDAGYASKQAAALQDNLAGDLEKLGGAFDTLMISVGSGAQGPLREIVQLFTGLVDGVGTVVGAFNSLPGPISAGVVAFGLLMALKGPMAGGLETIGLKALYMKDNFVGAVTSTEGLKGAMGGLAGAFTPVNIGIGAVTLLLPAFINLIKGLTGNSADATAGQRALADALKATNGVIDENVTAAARQQLINEGLVSTFKAAGISSRDAIDGLLGNADAQERVNTKLQDFIGKNVGTGEMFSKQIVGANEAQDKYQQLAAALGMSKEEADYFAGAATGAAGAAGAAGSAAAAAAPGVAALGGAAGMTKDQVSELGQSMADFVTPLDTYTGMLQAKAQAEADAANKTAATTGGASKSWQDFKDSVHVTFDEYMADLQGQVDAQANWQTNMLMLAGRVSAGTLAELSRMGPEGAPLVADLVNRSDAELDKFDDVTAKRSKEATDAWGAQLAQAAPVLAAVGKIAGQGVVNELAAQLQAGTTNIAAIAAQYGISLAGGINPILVSLGKTPIAYRGPAVKDYWSGGYTGDGAKYTPAGIVHKGEFVMPQQAVNRIGVGTLGAMAGLPGYAGGGFVSAASVPRPRSTAPFQMPLSTGADGAMSKEYDEVTAWVTANTMSSSAAFGGMAAGGVQRWLPLVLQALSMVGQPASLAQTVLRRMNQESSGNPNAVNLTDSNARAGHPSRGLMQTIPSTFYAYAMPGYNTNIVDPLSNILASMRYALARYGSLAAAYNKPGGYKLGTNYVPEDGPAYLHKGEAVIPADVNLRSREMSGASSGWAGGGGPVNVQVNARVFVGTREITDIARVEATSVVVNALTGAVDRGRYNP